MNGSDHDRVVTSGAWAGAMAAAAVLMWADNHMPYACAWLLNTAVVLGTAYGMARWKRAWYAWLCFWALAVICAAEGILKAATTLLDAPWSNATWVFAWLLVGCWYWLVRAPRRQPPAPRQEIHVIHHHVLHLPGQHVTAGEVPAGPRQLGQPAALRAIAARAAPPGDLAALLGRLAARAARHRKAPQ